ncbi:MAG: type II secretion system protein [Candidatus Paceibacterota bacterium]
MQKYRSFTLVELLVIIAIIGILSSLIYVQTNNAVNSGKDSKRKSDVALLASGVHVYSIGSDLPISSPCNIGSTCSSEIDEALIDQLGPLPTDPDSDKAYIYQSDGTDCTISSVLSNGETYQYDCSDDAMTQSEPIAGQCGGAAASYMPGTTTWTSSEFCLGTTPSSNPSFPSADGTSVSWTCPGQYLGSPTTCTAYRGQNGVCGTLVNTTSTAYSPETSSYPSSDYCSSGDLASTPSFPEQGSSSLWVCNAKYAGTNASCTAYRGQNGVCGTSANGNYYLSSEIINPCGTGTATVTGSGSPTGYFTWSCPFTYVGSNASCTANLKVDGVCGSRAATYPYTQTDWTASTYYCSSGTASASPSFPGVGSSVNWNCSGVNGGVAAQNCTATRESIPMLYGNVHSYLDCTNAEGEVVDFSSGKQCRFTATSCPSGTPSWTYSGWLNVTNTSSCNTSTGWMGIGITPPVYCQNYDQNDWECVCPGGTITLGRNACDGGFCCCSAYATYLNYNKIGCY